MPPVKWLKIATKHHPVGTRKFTSILITSLFLIYHHTNLIKIANSKFGGIGCKMKKKMFLSSSLFFYY